MALDTPGDLIALALKNAGIVGVGQSALAEDSNDALDTLNNILAEWQINRWLVPDLVDLTKVSTAAVSYTVGPAGDFNTGTTSQRPDKLDAMFARLTASGVDYPLFPFMSREGYDRIAAKSTAGIPEAFFYDPTTTKTGTGTVYVYPVPAATYTLHVNVKASLPQFAALTDTIALPLPHVNALLWCLTKDLRPLYQLPGDPQVDMRVQRALAALAQSIGQVPQAVQPEPSQRSGIYAGTA